MKKIFTTLLAMAIMTVGFSQVVAYEENFDDAGADLRWNIGQDAGADNSADFFYDYITAGIPAAPNGGGLGLKLESNITSGVASQIYAFPAGESFSGHYIVSFDMWMATDTTGSGTTEFAIFGVMHTDEIVPSGNGIDYCLTGENGSARDVRVYEEGLELLASNGEGGYALDVNGVMTQNINTDDGIPYMDDLVEGMAFGKWVAVAIEVNDTDMIWTMNDSIWSSMPNVLAQAGNIALGYMDLFSSVADPTGSMFGLYDNVVVTQMPGVGVEEVEISTVSVYPNPASEFLNVVVSERSTFELINYLGQTIQRSMVDQGKSTLSLSEVKQGVYFAKFTTDNGAVEIHKVVVQ